ncbi:HNH endonuclease signature motif containing protein [Aspergillus alliaceus]|uniref:HNH endonuclease signature motif containing protein n=1 Tax=Petromyces alliaceus TaxID=209559 RepID=UPI0012A404C7|nr:uncharacterized protein BDW43DRAFT_304764 [Aspergillus alliaceus]KAB8227225.1 hypothetical protein BDW43DRAFT_304764 [Aspergillus alliaceus]
MSSISSDSCPESDVFSTATKTEVRRLAGDRCWVCQSTEPQICHVIANEDKQLDVWFEAGLLNFSLLSAANGIPLCATCHTQFDRAHDPGFVFIPTDLQYFIDFELEDRERRLASNTLPRQVPTSVMYRDHLMKEKKIPDDTTSGLYRPIFLKEYLLQGIISVEDLGFTKPKQWHGAPIATLRRGILALGSARITSLDKVTVAQLQVLRDLYFRPVEDNSVNVRSSLVQPDIHCQKRRTDDDDDEQPKNKRFKRDSTRTDKPEHMDGNDLDAKQHYLRAFEAEWVLGPNFTTEQIIHRYAPLFAHD